MPNGHADPGDLVRPPTRPEPTLVEDKGEPVYIDPTFYRDAQTAAEALYDDSIDPATVVAHPCTVSKAYVPDLVELIEESWAETFEEPDEIKLSEPMIMILEGVRKLLQAAAPDVWMPRTRERIELPKIMGGMIAT